ncbi:MAG: ABC transporter ATP-binding protein, partial [Deltaproteobacteria bacterium]|nr:ABC transporter ATP-binding protein [Deltaproteobacteria bacterium]
MSFGKTRALEGITADVPAGRISGLVGPDAAGTSTRMRLLAGLMLPSAGELRIFGQEPARLVESAPNSIGYMPQRFGLYEDLTVADNLRLHARLRAVEGGAREALFDRLLSFTSLKPFTARLAGRLSGGMKQKLGIACAMLGSPRLLLLDEPGVGVDPQSRRELWRMVAELVDDGMTIIWSTSYLEEAERCPHVLMLDRGRLVYAGAPAAMSARMRGRVYVCASPQGVRSDLDFW